MQVIFKYKGCTISDEDIGKYFKAFKNLGVPTYLIPTRNLENTVVVKMARLANVSVENSQTTLEFI